jgi:hypothetical protein
MLCGVLCLGLHCAHQKGKHEQIIALIERLKKRSGNSQKRPVSLMLKERIFSFAWKMLFKGKNYDESDE